MEALNLGMTIDCIHHNPSCWISATVVLNFT